MLLQIKLVSYRWAGVAGGWWLVAGVGFGGQTGDGNNRRMTALATFGRWDNDGEGRWATMEKAGG